MRSSSSDEHAARKASLARRVTLAAVASSVLGGSVAALSAVLIVDRLVESHADRRLFGATITLAGELDEELAEQDGDTVADIVADENDEIAASGVQLAVFDGDQRIGGEAWIASVSAGVCRSSGPIGARVRACAIGHDGQVLVAALPWDRQELRWLYLLAGLSALVVGGGAGALASFQLTRWAMAPLVDLTRALERVPPAGAKPDDLGPEPRVREVARIRSALLDLIGRSSASIDVAQRFAADAAHELRTPLTALRAELELFAEDSRGSDRAAIERSLDQVRRLCSLLERLLVLSTSLDDADEHFEPVALADVIADVVRERPLSERERLIARVVTDGTIAGDATLLHSLIWNLIDNALKFSDGPVTLSLEEVDSFVRFEVTDTGPGIPESERQRIFAPFHRLKPDASPGHGVGLALVAHIARAHRASVEAVESPEGAKLRADFPAWSATPAQPFEPARWL